MPEEASASARPAIVIPPALEPLAAKKRWVVWKLWSDSGKDRSAKYHRCTQSIDEIARQPVAPLAAEDCALLLWCTWSHIAIGSPIKIMEACGFRPCPAAFNWVKTNADGSRFGCMGYYTRSDGEVCLFATSVYACLTAQTALNSKEREFLYAADLAQHADAQDDGLGHAGLREPAVTLEPDRDQLEIFLDAVLRYRGDEGYLSLRAFFHSNKPLHSNLWTARLGPRTGSGHVLDTTVDLARRAANTPEPAVFCPPLAVFNNSDGFKAREEDLLKGLAISVECDQHPEEARQKLQDIFGQATAIVRSGGQWVNGDGEPEDKLHLHWRLRTPATGADLAKLKQARRLAADLVGGDASNVPAVHCLRWPGSWHRKKEPRLCEFIAWNPDIEIDLDEALAALEAAAPARGPGARNGQSCGGADEATLIASIRNGLHLHDSINRLAAKYIVQGSTINDAIARLQAYMNDSKARLERTKDWQARYDDIARSVESAYFKFQRGEHEHEPEPEPAPEDGDPGDQPVSDHTRPTIPIVAGRLPEAVVKSEQALRNADFQIFACGPALVFPGVAELPTGDGRTIEGTVLRELVVDRLLCWLAEAATFIKYDARSKGWVKCDPPRQLAATLLAPNRRPFFLPIAGVIASPTLRPDGSLLDQPGYDPTTHLYFAPDPRLRLPPLSEQPTQDEAKKALALLKSLLPEFKFANETDRSVALALILTHAARGAMPVAPLFLVRAHTPGTGKSYLIDLVTAIVTGKRYCAVIAAGATAEETEKRLGALLHEGTTIIALDTARTISAEMRFANSPSAPWCASESSVIAKRQNLRTRPSSPPPATISARKATWSGAH
jgi:hypothetical protein